MEPKTPSRGEQAPAPRRRPERQELPEPEEMPRYEDPLDEVSAESMDASDPPARGTARIGPAKGNTPER